MGVHGRADFCQAMLYAGGVPFELDDNTANNWPSTREESPFGQLPYLKHGGLTIGQGGAINRYCARLAGLYPTNPIEASICDMYMEEVMDIFNGLFKVYIICNLIAYSFCSCHTLLEPNLIG